MLTLPRLLLALAFVPLAAGQTAALAGEGERIRNVGVSYSDLNLETEAGARELLRRLNAAAYKACGGDPERHSSFDLMPEVTRKTFETCRAEAIDTAVGRLDAPLVARLHQNSAA